MRTDSHESCYLLRSGSPREEEWSRRQIEAMVAAGELSPDDRVYDPDRDAWVPLGETAFADAFPRAGDDDADAASAESLEADYAAIVERLEADPSSLELRIEAARLAAGIGDRRAAARHLQAALDARPFHPRVAREVRQRFSPVECRRFRFLDRPEAPWDDLGAMVTWPAGAGPVGLLAPMVVACALLVLVPGGAGAVIVLAGAWSALHARAAACGLERPTWRALVRPARVAAVRVAAGLAGVAPVVGAFLGVAAVLARIDATVPRGAPAYLAASPVLLVSLATLLVLWMPAALAAAAAAPRPLASVLPWRLVAAAAAMESEYVTTVLLAAVLTFVFGWLGVIGAGVPGMGVLVAAVAVGYAVPVLGAMAGRLGARHVHQFGASSRTD